MKTFLLLGIAMSSSGNASGMEYPCSQKTIVQRPYGRVEQRVDCSLSDKWKFVAEYKGSKKHGISLVFDKKLGWKSDSTFFKNGLEEGESLVWDSNGNIRGRHRFKSGKRFGRQESFWSPGKPYSIQNFNRRGEEEGPQREWWENGNIKSETVSKNDLIISGTEYYPSGKPRVSYTIQYNPKAGAFTSKYSAASSWAPDGRPTGSVVNGTGSYMIWSAEPETPFVVHQEFRKDGELVTVKELDSAQVEAWIRSNPISK